MTRRVPLVPSAPPEAVPARRAAQVRIYGVVQGVGFRPFVYRLARARGLTGWVRNDERGAAIHVEGPEAALAEFVTALEREPPPAARIERVEVVSIPPLDLTEFEIEESERAGAPSARITPDLAVCLSCLSELEDPEDRRYRYPYINCTNCGPRYSIVRALPYDRPNTTMADWPMCAACAAEYVDPLDRRFHAQPIACPACGPGYRYVASGQVTASADADAYTAIRRAARALLDGGIVAVKGIGGYHLVCDARQPGAVEALRTRKYRKEQPFALMARELAVARSAVHLSADAEAWLTGPARPIVLAPARIELEGVAPGRVDLGVMLPYAPVHRLLFDAGAPDLLVMTSGNRSSEPIAYQDDDARARLAGIADAWLVGARPIARRVDDSVVRVDAPFAPAIIRRGRGLAPGVVAQLPCASPVLAVGGDLKNTITLVAGGDATMSQHIGDLAHQGSREACEQAIGDLLAMYEIDMAALTVAHDRHPQYASTAIAAAIPAARHCAVQHHRAHIASVLAEHGALETPVVGIALDGTGYGDDGAIWGAEVFVGSVAGGLQRVGHLREAALVGGDAAAQHPVQAAAGFLAQLSETVDVTAPPFAFPARYGQARELIARDVRIFRTTSMGRLFDCLAALLGFIRPVTYEAQAAMWLEQLARRSESADRYEMPYRDGEFDFRPLLASVLSARGRGHPLEDIARAAHHAVADGVVEAACTECRASGSDVVVLSGGVCQNAVLMSAIGEQLAARGHRLWVNRVVPPNDGGISLGQAALATAG